MKRTKILIALAVMALLGMVGCKGNDTKPLVEDASDSLMMETGEDDFLDAIDIYLTELGGQYAPGEVCIPSFTVTAVDESNNDETRVWGDWWVFNYNIVGDTLKCVSGGSHPGMMTLKQDDASKWFVSAFDQVEDGHGNVASAKHIFGQYYEAFHAANSDQEARENVRLQMTANYVCAHGLKVKYLQDYGWPAVTLPL